MEQAVVVIDIMNNDALVRGRRASACGQCAGKSACGTLGSWTDRFSEMRVANSMGAKIGDEVIICVPDGMLLRAAIRLYGVPMLGFFMMGFLVRYVAFQFSLVAPELWAAGGAMVGLLVAFLWLHSTSNAAISSGASIVQIKSRAVNVPVKLESRDSFTFS